MTSTTILDQPTPADAPAITPDAARAALAAAAQERRTACATALQALLDELRFTLDVSIELSARGAEPKLQIVLLD